MCREIMGGKYKSVLVLLGFVGMMMMMVRSVASSSISHDYGDALSKCILFFEGQRSGKLPSSQRMTWRKDSALHDGSNIDRDPPDPPLSLTATNRRRDSDDEEGEDDDDDDESEKPPPPTNLKSFVKTFVKTKK
ncbi:hypothetical protein LWI29_006037 [Acer saccharum]|uniref:cellulase n=1 Tax=Acer saccharum TaxID=4024 RepID=A0AA39VXZ3_ACESA|nr:hypothetical protein LWI29_006037 [Acer saccharum]